MTPENFCYWLQGFFELSGITTITPDQSECIARHSELVLAYCASIGTPVPAVITEIRVMLRVMDTTSTRLVYEITRALGAQFEHVIDPKAGPEHVQQALNNIHHQGAGKPLMRC